MKKIIALVIASSLLAAVAHAAPEQILRSTSKNPPVKISGSGTKAGLLDCSGAIEVSLDNIYSGDNTGAANNVSVYGCSTWDESGGEVVYHLYLSTPTYFEATLTGSGCDLDLAVLDSCDEDLGCLIVVDSGVITNVAVSGDFYFVVDGYGGAGCPFDLEIVTGTPPPPPPAIDFCASVEDVFGTSFTGTTCNGVNAVSSLGCEDFTEDGLEYYYEIFMPAASSFTADVFNTADGALWVVDSCMDPLTCLAYADNTLSNDTETISYTNATANDMYVYLVIDSWGTDTCGDYEMTFQASGGAVPAETASFGAIKAQFR